jgi:ABC-2 type transport system permease protein
MTTTTAGTRPSSAVGARPAPSRIQQWWVLTVRVIVPTLRNGEVLTQVAACVMFTCGFYIPLKHMMGIFAASMSSYAQYLMPLIALQAISFAAVSAAFRSATDSVQGIDRRFKSMPIGAMTPLAARMTASMYRCSLALVVSLACGYVIGFRFYGPVSHAVGFCGLVLLVGAVLSYVGDMVGVATENPEATTHMTMLPQLIFGLMSTGVQPAEQFPKWIQGFVRNQPVSQLVYSLRALAGDSGPGAGAVTWPVIGPALAWMVPLLLTGIALSIWVSRRRR